MRPKKRVIEISGRVPATVAASARPQRTHAAVAGRELRAAPTPMRPSAAAAAAVREALEAKRARKLGPQPGLIYATLLPSGLIKVGFAAYVRRALAAQTYNAERVQILALWKVPNKREAEARAHEVLAAWWVSGELFSVPAGWLGDVHPLVARVSSILGEPIG